jgi:hypothetical protein
VREARHRGLVVALHVVLAVEHEDRGVELREQLCDLTAAQPLVELYGGCMVALKV